MRDISLYQKIAVPLSCLVIGASLFWGAPPLIWQLVLLGAVVFGIGMPHGALDWFNIQKVASSTGEQLVISGLYGGVAVLVACLWFLMPTIIFPLLLLMAWLHFGLSDSEQTTGHIVQALEVFVRGAMVLVFPLFFYQAEIVSLFLPFVTTSQMMISEVTQAIRLVLGPLSFLAWLFIAGLSLYKKTFRTAAEFLLIGLLFILCTPLIAFSVYFGAWHSLKHLVDEWPDEKMHLGGTMVTTGIVCALSFVIFVPLLFLPATDPAAPWLRFIFIALLSLTIPHMILSFAAQYLRKRSRRQV